VLIYKDSLRPSKAGLVKKMREGLGESIQGQQRGTTVLALCPAKVGCAERQADVPAVSQKGSLSPPSKGEGWES
jgi:hypothetical protein